MTFIQCSAKSKTTQQRCKRPVVPGMTVCRFHGGLTPVGMASPNFKTGRYSKYLPDNLAGKYREARADPDLLSLRDDIQLVDSRLNFLLELIKKNKTEELWDTLVSGIQTLMDTCLTGTLSEVTLGVRTLKELIEKENNNRDTWVEIYNVLEGRRRLTESEQKRLIAMNQTITAEKAMMLLGAISEIIRQHVKDPGELAAIAADIRRLTTLPTGGQHFAGVQSDGPTES